MNDKDWARPGSQRLVCQLELWAQEAEAELAFFDHWREAELHQVQQLRYWLSAQKWELVAQDWDAHRDAVEQVRSQCLRLCGDAWLALGPSLSPALNSLIWVLENPDSLRQAEAVAATECILQQAREQGWDRSDEAAFSELSEKLDQCLMAILTSAGVDDSLLDRLVELLDRTTYADVTGPTSSRCWNSWIRLLESAPLEELSEPLSRLDADVQAFARALKEETLWSEYGRLSRAFRAHRSSAAREDWVADFESVLCELDQLARPRTHRARQLCLQFQLGALTLVEYQEALQDLRQCLNELSRTLVRRGDEAQSTADATARLSVGLELLEGVDKVTQSSEMVLGCENIERGLEMLQAHG